MKKPIKINLPSVILSLALVGMLIYISIDAFVTRPQFKNQVELVTSDFGDLKVYLETKLPQIDSALVIHTGQIAKQNVQLEELNELAKVLKDE